MDITNILATKNYDDVLRRISPVSSIQEGRTPQELQSIKDAAESFESYFLQMMFREMRKTISDEDGLIPKSRAEKIFTEMLDEQISKEVASGPNGIGLADTIVRQLTLDSYKANMR